MKINLMKRAFIVGAILLLGFSAVRAEEACLIITTKAGTTAQFLIADTPVITYQDNLLKVEGGGNEVSVEAEQVVSVDFVSGVSGIDGVTVNGSLLSGLLPGTPVEVYTLDGRHVASYKADESNTVRVDLEKLSPGFYILRTPSASFKIKKM